MPSCFGDIWIHNCSQKPHVFIRLQRLLLSKTTTLTHLTKDVSVRFQSLPHVTRIGFPHSVEKNSVYLILSLACSIASKKVFDIESPCEKKMKNVFAMGDMLFFFFGWYGDSFTPLNKLFQVVQLGRNSVEWTCWAIDVHASWPPWTMVVAAEVWIFLGMYPVVQSRILKRSHCFRHFVPLLGSIGCKAGGLVGSQFLVATLIFFSLLSNLWWISPLLWFCSSRQLFKQLNTYLLFFK